MEEGVTIAKVPDWMVLKPEMMPHLIKEHEKIGRTLTEEETVTLLRSLGFEISEPKDEWQRACLGQVGHRRIFASENALTSVNAIHWCHRGSRLTFCPNRLL